MMHLASKPASNTKYLAEKKSARRSEFDIADVLAAAMAAGSAILYALAPTRHAALYASDPAANAGKTITLHNWTHDLAFLVTNLA